MKNQNILDDSTTAKLKEIDKTWQDLYTVIIAKPTLETGFNTIRYLLGIIDDLQKLVYAEKKETLLAKNNMQEFIREVEKLARKY